LLGEWACHQTDRVSYLEFNSELQNASPVGRCYQRLDHPLWNRIRLITPHYQPRHPKGAVDAAPLMAGQIEDDEEIAGKKRRLDGAYFARMSNALTPFWLEGSEPLAIELTLGACFS
jgi:hypothetical protein